MKKHIVLLLAAPAMIGALAAGYFFSQGNSKLGVLFILIAAAMLIVLLALSNASKPIKAPKQKSETAYSGRLSRDIPVINLAFYGELSRLIDENRDTGAYLRSCGAPQNIVKSVNIGGATQWYYHRDGTEYNEFCADYERGKAQRITHPYLKDQRIEDNGSGDTHCITVDLYRALWDWGAKHPEKKKYANSMRLALIGSYSQSEGHEDASFLDKTIEEVKAERKTFKKDPTKKKNRNKDISEI